MPIRRRRVTSFQSGGVTRRKCRHYWVFRVSSATGLTFLHYQPQWSVCATVLLRVNPLCWRSRLMHYSGPALQPVTDQATCPAPRPSPSPWPSPRPPSRPGTAEAVCSSITWQLLIVESSILLATSRLAQAVYKRQKKNMVYNQHGLTGTVIYNNNVFSVFVLVSAA